MDTYLIAYDLGTSGNKAALYNVQGACVAECFEAYQTFYPRSGWHEQRPLDWWQAVAASTRRLLAESGVDPAAIVCCGISGHSLGVVPLDAHGNLLREATPIWSDSRASEQAQRFFQNIPEAEWYTITGNGFPPPLYSVFKIMWFRDHEPEMFARVDKFIGTKDYINYRLTGFIGSDYSYASGTGVYDLLGWKYSPRLIEASGLSASLFPEIVASTQVIGTLHSEAAAELGLKPGIKVVCGGVDNSCMALGARNTREGRVYNSQGSSSWIAVSSSKPLIDLRVRPYVFTHVLPGMFTSAVSTFSAGTSFRWVRDHFCRDLKEQAERQQVDVYDLMTAEAAQSPVGANGLLFNPNMAGGTSMSPSVNIRGAFLGLDLAHTRADILRAAMEGIALELRLALDELRRMQTLSSEMLVVGGGSHSSLWRQIYADVYEMDIVKTNIDQQAAALGAAACAAVGAGLWHSFDIVDEIHQVEDITRPIAAHSQVYRSYLPIFARAGEHLAELGDRIAALRTG
ncbi:MAG: pentose kinase [Anaerolineae bacterium]|nr:pentose kinase [Anaerolineae bacterium]